MENQKEEIAFADWLKVDIRTGSVLTAERVPKSSKLLQLSVDFGELGSRVIVAGVGETFQPEEMIGKQVVCVLNLAPRKMMGIESFGMVLCAHTADGLLSLLQCPNVVNGTSIG